MSLPRLIASDLDGTLLRGDGSLSPRTLRALRTAEEAGAEIVIVTARPPRFVDRLAEATGLVGTAVCSNGALVYDMASRSVVASQMLSLTVARQVATALAAAVPGVGFALETGNQVFYEPAYRLRLSEDEGAELPVASLAELWLTEAPVTKLLAWTEQLDADTLLAAARQGPATPSSSPTPAGAGCWRSAPPASPRPAPSPCSARSGASRRRTSSRSATCPTTSRSSPGPARATPWPTPTRRSWPPWRHTPGPTRRTGWPRSSSTCSRCGEGLRALPAAAPPP